MKIETARDYEFDDAVERLTAVRDSLESLKQEQYYLARLIGEQMGEMGATKARTEAGDVVRLERSVTYDPHILAKLREITDPADLLGTYTPEHDEVMRIPEKWNMVKGRKLGTLGTEHQAIIDDAKIYSAPKVKIDEKGERSTR